MQILNILIYLLTLGCLKVRIVERELLPCLPFQKKKCFRATHCCLLKVRQEPLFAGCTGPLLPRTDFCCCAWAFSSCSEHGLLSTCGVQTPCSSGFSCCGAQALWCTGSIVVVLGLIFPPGNRSVSPTLAGGSLTTEPQERPLPSFLRQGFRNSLDH